MHEPLNRETSLSLRREYNFDAAHKLDWHPGKCRNLHGHSYILEVEVKGKIDERGVVMDFAEIDQIVNPNIIDRLDHCYLNEMIDNPTAERIILTIADWLDVSTLPWSELTLHETARSSVTVRSSDE